MSVLEDLLKKVEGKLRMLKFTSDGTASVLERKQNQIKRHAEVLESLIEEVHKLKVDVQQEKIGKGGEPSEVRKWSHDLDQKILQFENIIEKVRAQGEEPYGIETQKAKGKEREIEEEKRRNWYEKEMALEEAKLEMKRKFEKGLEEAKMKSAIESKQFC